MVKEFSDAEGWSDKFSAENPAEASLCSGCSEFVWDQSKVMLVKLTEVCLHRCLFL